MSSDSHYSITELREKLERRTTDLKRAINDIAKWEQLVAQYRHNEAKWKSTEAEWMKYKENQEAILEKKNEKISSLQKEITALEKQLKEAIASRAQSESDSFKEEFEISQALNDDLKGQLQETTELFEKATRKSTERERQLKQQYDEQLKLLQETQEKGKNLKSELDIIQKESAEREFELKQQYEVEVQLKSEMEKLQIETQEKESELDLIRKESAERERQLKQKYEAKEQLKSEMEKLQLETQEKESELDLIRKESAERERQLKQQFDEQLKSEMEKLQLETQEQDVPSKKRGRTGDFPFCIPCQPGFDTNCTQGASIDDDDDDDKSMYSDEHFDVTDISMSDDQTGIAPEDPQTLETVSDAPSPTVEIILSNTISATEKQQYSEAHFRLTQYCRELERKVQVYERERKQVVEMTYLDEIAKDIIEVGQDIQYTLASCNNVALEGFLQDSIPMVDIGGGDVPKLIVDMNENNEVGMELLQNKVYVSKLKECMSARNNRFPVLPNGKLKGKNVFVQANHREGGYMATEGRSKTLRKYFRL
ncbi:predicted protein [Chaetoceros tenuissimus]|uniref:Uncharacterized protein n=1 Tax=Chaetoceros tenuissimus TaxID=426638 RepID=A0AAD3D996_9STRA|nr:predicted protein [Chaetoceros tenuissimus]